MLRASVSFCRVAALNPPPARAGDDWPFSPTDTTISVQTTEGEVLAVPVAALSMAADGTTRVQVQDSRGATRYVTVEPGLAAKGVVAVTPVGGELGPGDLVVVGANTAHGKGAEGAGKK